MDKVDRLQHNARSHLKASQVIWNNNEYPGDQLIAPSLLCLAYFYELHCKVVLLRAGVVKFDALGKEPYRHDIWLMWTMPALEETREDAESYVQHFAKTEPDKFPDGQPVETFNAMLQRLSKMHTTESGFALRYPKQIEQVYPPDVLLAVAKEICS